MRLYEFTDPKTQFGQDVEQKLLDAHMLNEWMDESVGGSVKIQICPLFAETYNEKLQGNAMLGPKMEEFKKVKLQNPVQPFGGSDTLFVKEAPLGKAIPKLRHAHLTQNLSVFYTISGSNPTVLKLYGVFSHADSGTGNNSNIKTQQKLGKKLANQDFI